MVKILKKVVSKLLCVNLVAGMFLSISAVVNAVGRNPNEIVEQVEILAKNIQIIQKLKIF